MGFLIIRDFLYMVRPVPSCPSCPRGGGGLRPPQPRTPPPPWLEKFCKARTEKEKTKWSDLVPKIPPLVRSSAKNRGLVPKNRAKFRQTNKKSQFVY